ncbi:MAG: hypothetical protein AAFP19_12485 [Bacteroidota bacterium]
MMIEKILIRSYETIFSDVVKHQVERVILSVAILSYIIHLLLILLTNQGILDWKEVFFTNPISAIYTPFSFILIYEVFLLIFFLPKSITIYLGKQYEIITLIVIRRIFKDIAYVDLTYEWFSDKNDLQLTFDVVTSLILFYLIFLFYKKIKKRAYTTIKKNDLEGSRIKKFVLLKKALAVLLIPIFAILAFYTLTDFFISTLGDHSYGLLAFKKLNNVFFDEFFTILIIIDVLLLLFSFFYSQQFYKIIRNSGFVISTILIKVSFFAEGLINNMLIISAVLIGYIILIIHNLYEKNELAMEEE